MKQVVASVLGTAILLGLFVLIVGRFPAPQRRIPIIVFIVVVAVTAVLIAFFSRKAR